MQLFFTNDSPLNTSLITETGETVYKIDTPQSDSTRTTTISRVVPQNGQNQLAIDGGSSGKFTAVAQIEWPDFSPSTTVRIGGEEIPMKKYLRNEGLGIFGKSRVFTAPDGRDYRWTVTLGRPKLDLKHSGPKVKVARYHRGSIGIVTERTHAALEILPAGIPIVDAVVMTFIYLEKEARDAEAVGSSYEIM
jgi:hypothetical protein